jgi:phosphoglycolate phosphatase
MRYPLVVFDFDGTLADSFAEGVAIFTRIGPALGIKTVDEVDLEVARGMPTRKFLKHVGVSLWRLPRVIRAYHAAASETAHRLKLFDGVHEMLARLHASGVTLGILSSNHEDNIRACLKANDVEQFFTFVIGSPKIFGKARALRRIRRRQRVLRAEMLYVGDEARDVIAARKARIDMAAVSWGFQPETLLRETGANLVLSHPSDLDLLVLDAAAA